MNKEKRTNRFTDGELDLIKNSFVENDALLTTLRKVFLQMELSPLDNSILESLKANTETVRVIKKSFLPELDAEAPINNIGDMWFWIPFQLSDKTPEEIYPLLLARKVFIAYITQQFNILENIGNVESKMIKFSSLINLENIEVGYPNFVARNWIISHIEAQLQFFTIWAGKKGETIEETRERLLKDSTK